MKKTFLAALAAMMGLQAAPALAENYEVNLTRKGSNVYKVDGKDIIIQTRYCYVYAYSEEAIFKSSGYGGEVIFFDSKDKCDVKAVFGLSKQKPGKYVVTVSREDDDWYLVTRTPGIHLLIVHVKDSAMLRLEFEGVTLTRRIGNPNIPLALEYSETTGVVRTLVRGGAKYQQMLIDAFAEHVLGVKAHAQRIRPPTLDLSMLRTGFDVPEVFEDGFSLVQLKALTFLSPDGALKLECTAMQASQQRSVHELLKEKLPGPLEGNWVVTAAQMNLYYPPEPGQTRSRVVSIEVTSKGRLNLPKFDAKMQAQLEGYLVSVGILNKGQTLSAQEVPPDANAVGSAPVIEG